MRGFPQDCMDVNLQGEIMGLLQDRGSLWNMCKEKHHLCEAKWKAVICVGWRIYYESSICDDCVNTAHVSLFVKIKQKVT